MEGAFKASHNLTKGKSTRHLRTRWLRKFRLAQQDFRFLIPIADQLMNMLTRFGPCFEGRLDQPMASRCMLILVMCSGRSRKKSLVKSSSAVARRPRVMGTKARKRITLKNSFIRAFAAVVFLLHLLHLFMRKGVAGKAQVSSRQRISVGFLRFRTLSILILL